LPPPEYRYVLIPSFITCLMADQYFKDTARTTDSIEATGSMVSSASPPGLANKFLSSDTSATAMAKSSLDLRDLEAAAALEALGMVPETQWPVTETSTLEMSIDSEVTFRKVLGSAEVLATRPGVDPLEVTRPLPKFGWTSQSPQAISPSVIARQPTYTSPGPWPPVASHVMDLRPLRSTRIYRIGKAAKPQIVTTQKTPVSFTYYCYVCQNTAAHELNMLGKR